MILNIDKYKITSEEEVDLQVREVVCDFKELYFDMPVMVSLTFTTPWFNFSTLFISFIKEVSILTSNR